MNLIDIHDPAVQAKVYESVGFLTTVIGQLNERWWRDPVTGLPIQRNKGEILALIHSEISEGLEGLRKNSPDDKLPHRPMLEVELADALIRLLDSSANINNMTSDLGPHDTGQPLDLAGILIGVCTLIGRTDFHTARAMFSIMDFAKHMGLDLAGAVTEKLVYNNTRADHRPENRLKPGGKRF